jgi:drug/metabolite transporter (DMT)-like permease
MLQGLFNFCMNYILTYTAEKYINSGLVALTFTSLIYFNMAGMKIFFKKKISLNVVLGAILGCMGITALFWREISSVNLESMTVFGIVTGLLATFFASMGNMFATYNHKQKIPVMTFNAFGMLYGCLFSFLYALITSQDFTLPPTSSFLFSLFYLSFFGTVVAFWAYQTLVGSLGAEKAAYTSIISPVIAVGVSNYFEKIPLTKELLLGMILCFLGNYIALKKPKNL